MDHYFKNKYSYYFIVNQRYFEIRKTEIKSIIINVNKIFNF